MQAAVKLRLLLAAAAVGLIALIANARTTVSGSVVPDTFALVYTYNQDHTQTYISSAHPPKPLRLTRFIFDVNTPGSGTGDLVFSIRRYWEGDGGYSAPLCTLTVRCDTLANPAEGHIHSEDCDGYNGPLIGTVPGELVVVEVLSQACAGSNNPEGNITVYLEE